MNFAITNEIIVTRSWYRICNVGKSFGVERDIRTFKEQNVYIYIYDFSIDNYVYW